MQCADRTNESAMMRAVHLRYWWEHDGEPDTEGVCIGCCCGGDHQLYGTGVWTNRRRYHG